MTEQKAAPTMLENSARPLCIENWGVVAGRYGATKSGASVVVDCGWGRLIFGQTFDTPQEIAEVLRSEAEGQRDVAFYVRDPHVVLASAPQTLFLANPAM